MSADTLIVVAAFDDRFIDNLKTLRGGDVVVVNTSQGGYATGAYIDAYNSHSNCHSYLFIHDSMRSVVPDCVEPFRMHGGSVVAWGIFPLVYDSEQQKNWVENQYPGVDPPRWGIFGPTFYATREAMEKAEPYFPKIPEDRMSFQGTERAWAWCFNQAGVEVGWLGHWDNDLMSRGPYPVFRKTFAARP